MTLCRLERNESSGRCSEEQYAKVVDRLNTLPSRVEHLIMLLVTSSCLSSSRQARLSVYTGTPIAYPRMVFLENALSLKFSPFVALGRLGIEGFVNKFNGDAELLDDLVLITFFSRPLYELIVFTHHKSSFAFDGDFWLIYLC